VHREPDNPTHDNYGREICYQAVVKKIGAIASDDIINLAERLAERIADTCYADLT